MGYGIWATEIKSWLMESKDHIASWVTEKDADVYRRNHLVHPDMYVTKVIK